MTTSTPISDLQKLMASLGYVMLHWCFLEDELTNTIRRLRTESQGSTNLIRVRGSFSDRLSEWRGLLSQKTRRNPELAEAVADLANEIERLRVTRNHIAHHLAGANAELDDEDQPYIWCAERETPNQSAEQARITLSDLHDMVDTIERCRGRFRTIGLSG